jgi:predicted transcriptional regulator
VTIDKNAILRLHMRGLNNAAIARELGCSRAYVSQTVKRERGWDSRIMPLSNEAHAKLRENARKHRKTPAKHARGMLETMLKFREIGNG